MKVRCRMAPSPTGKLHVGTAHTALFNFLFAKHHGGSFILRIDDSDQTRSKTEFEADIIDCLKWLGIYWDEGSDIGGPFAPYRQSERGPIYKKFTEKLISNGAAYRCFCTQEELEAKRKEAEAKGQVYRYDLKCRKLSREQIQKNLDLGLEYTVRFNNPNKTVTFLDMVRGKISVDTSAAGDFIIVRSDGSPLLNFAVVVDDLTMKITHAIRGEDFLNATPYQLLLFEALGATAPKIANLSFIYAPDHTKLSKRHGATGISQFREMGYLPEAMVNFLAFLGWNPGDDREIFTLDELIKEFDFDRVQKGAPTFNKVKLDWYNQQYIRALDEVTLAKRVNEHSLHDEGEIARVLPLVKDRLVTLKDFDDLTGYFFEAPKIDPKEFKKIKANALDVLKLAVQILKKNWDGKVLEDAARKYCADNDIKVGDYFMVLRIAVCGRTTTPPLWEVMETLGKDESLARLQGAAQLV